MTNTQTRRGFWRPIFGLSIIGFTLTTAWFVGGVLILLQTPDTW